MNEWPFLDEILKLGIPAVIGVGEKEHGRLKMAKSLRIDCANKRIEVLR